MVTSTLKNADASPHEDRRVFFFRHLRPHKSYVRRDVRMVMTFNPKVGTTTLRSALIEGLEAAGNKPRVGPYWPINRQRRFLMAPPTEFLDVILHPDRYQFYAFVRNPYARVVSAWNNKFAHCHLGDQDRCSRRYAPILRKFAARHGLPGGAANSPIPFETFLQFVESQAEGRRDHHWDTQRAVLQLDGVSDHKLFRIESDFATGAMEVLTRAGVDAEWVAQRLRKPRNVSPKRDEPVLTEELAERVYRIYECDFQRLGYERDSWRNLGVRASEPAKKCA